MAGEPIPFVVRPVVEGATYTVRCSCGFKHDAVAETADEAMDNLALRHLGCDGTMYAMRLKEG